MKNFRYVALSAGILCLCLIMAGCSTLPENVDECADLYDDPAKISKCEYKVIRQEERAFEYEERKRMYGRVAAACWRAGGYYDEWSRSCRMF